MSSTQKGFNVLKKVYVSIIKSKRFDNVMQKVKIIDVGNGICKAEFTVAEEHLNCVGGLHGGFIATLVDNITTYALMTKNSHPGSSVNLHVSYLKGAMHGDEIIIEAKTIKAGKTLAFLKCELRHKKDGSLIAKGGQSKFVEISF